MNRRNLLRTVGTGSLGFGVAGWTSKITGIAKGSATTGVSGHPSPSGDLEIVQRGEKQLRRLYALLQEELAAGHDSDLMCRCILHDCNMWSTYILGHFNLDGRLPDSYLDTLAEYSNRFTSLFYERRGKHLSQVRPDGHAASQALLDLIRSVRNELEGLEVPMEPMSAGLDGDLPSQARTRITASECPRARQCNAIPFTFPVEAPGTILDVGRSVENQC